MSRYKSKICIWCNNEIPFISEYFLSEHCPNCGSNCLRYAEVEKDYSFSNCAIAKISSKIILNNIYSGSVWLQSPIAYQKYEDKSIISDEEECKYVYYNGKNGNHQINHFAKNYRLFCMTAIKFNGVRLIENKMDKRFKGFGDYFSIIYLEDFYRAIRRKLNRNYHVELITNGGVKYLLPHNYRGFYAPMLKKDNYAWQQEWRIVVYSCEFESLNNEPVKLTGLENIKKCMSEPRPLDELLKAKNFNEILPLSH